MGLFDWWRARKADRIKTKQLETLERLRKFTAGERKELDKIQKLIEIIEGLVQQGKSDEADKYVSDLLREMERKQVIDNVEKKDTKEFKKLVVKHFKAEINEVK